MKRITSTVCGVLGSIALISAVPNQVQAQEEGGPHVGPGWFTDFQCGSYHIRIMAMPNPWPPCEGLPCYQYRSAGPGGTLRLFNGGEPTQITDNDGKKAWRYSFFHDEYVYFVFDYWGVPKNAPGGGELEVDHRNTPVLNLPCEKLNFGFGMAGPPE